jgi:MFS superfamily sulfate permease-like transporter
VLLFLTKPLQYLPNAVLSAVVFLIGLKLIDVADMRGIWRLRRDEFWVAAATAVVVVVVGVEQGIVLAIVLSLLLHVRRHYLPVDRVVGFDAKGRYTLEKPTPGAETEPGLVVYRFGVGLFYANAERLSDEVLALVDTPIPPKWLVLQADAIDDVDYTGGETLLELAGQLAERKIVFGIAEPSDQLRAELGRFGITRKIGSDHIYDSLDAALDAFRAATGAGS